MNEVERIRKRINNKGKTYNFKIPNIFLLFIIVLLFAMIYMKKDPAASQLNEMLQTNVTFYDFNNKIENIFGNLYDYSVNNNNEQQISYKPIYFEKEKNLFYTDTNYIPSLGDGNILYLEKENENYIMIVNYKDFIATYFNIVDPNVELFDVIQSGDILGTYINEFKVLFKKGNNLISYNETIS